MLRFIRLPSQIALASLAALAVAVVGCASWKDDDRSVTTQLPMIRENTRAIILDVEFVPIVIEGGDSDGDASLWQWVDETTIDSDARRRLIANGLRIGRISNEERFRAKLDSLSTNQDVVDQFLTQASVASEVSHSDKRIPMRLGRRYELPVRQPVEGSHVTLVRLGEETIGRTLNDPQYLFAILASAAETAGQVKVRLRPEVQHGAMKQNWVGSDSALRIDTRRETWSIEQLDVEFTGREGETFVVAGINPLSGLAKEMLSGSSADHTQQQVVVLIKVDQIPSAAELL